MDYGIFCHYKTIGLYWFRVFGYGMLIKNIDLHLLLFSQRTGKKGLVLCGIYLETLKP